MNTLENLRQEQDAQAIQWLKDLEIFKPYINDYKTDNERNVVMFERFVGFWVWQYKEVFEKMQAIEKEYKCKVYAITHEITTIGEMYSFLIVPRYKDDWGHCLVKAGKNVAYAYAYVWNKSYDYDSEFGTIGVQYAFGGLRRIS